MASKAKLNGRLFDAIDFHMLFDMGLIDGTPKCSYITCDARVVPYGNAAANRAMLDVRRPHDVTPRFNHFMHEGPNCPLRAKEKEEYLAGKEMLGIKAGPLPPVLEITREMTEYTLAVWAHMFGEKHSTLKVFDEAKAEATQRGLLNIKREDAWCLPFALSLKREMRNDEGEKVFLARQSLVADLTPRQIKTGNDSHLYVVKVHNFHQVSGPFSPNELATDKYAGRRISRKHAKQEINPPLPIHLHFQRRPKKQKAPLATLGKR